MQPGCRSIPVCCVARRLHTEGYARSSRLANRVTRLPFVYTLFLDKPLRGLDHTAQWKSGGPRG